MNKAKSTSYEKAMTYAEQYYKHFRIDMSKIDTDKKWTKEDELENEKLLNQIKKETKEGNIVIICEDYKQ